VPGGLSRVVDPAPPPRNCGEEKSRNPVSADAPMAMPKISTAKVTIRKVFFMIPPRLPYKIAPTGAEINDPGENVLPAPLSLRS
jgi:hypothetical protein